MRVVFVVRLELGVDSPRAPACSIDHLFGVSPVRKCRVHMGLVHMGLYAPGRPSGDLVHVYGNVNVDVIHVLAIVERAGPAHQWGVFLDRHSAVFHCIGHVVGRVAVGRISIHRFCELRERLVPETVGGTVLSERIMGVEVLFFLGVDDFCGGEVIVAAAYLHADASCQLEIIGLLGGGLVEVLRLFPQVVAFLDKTVDVDVGGGIAFTGEDGSGVAFGHEVPFAGDEEIVAIRVRGVLRRDFQ